MTKKYRTKDGRPIKAFYKQDGQTKVISQYEPHPAPYMTSESHVKTINGGTRIAPSRSTPARGRPANPKQLSGQQIDKVARLSWDEMVDNHSLTVNQAIERASQKAGTGRLTESERQNVIIRLRGLEAEQREQMKVLDNPKPYEASRKLEAVPETNTKAMGGLRLFTTTTSMEKAHDIANGNGYYHFGKDYMIKKVGDRYEVYQDMPTSTAQPYIHKGNPNGQRVCAECGKPVKVTGQREGMDVVQHVNPKDDKRCTRIFIEKEKTERGERMFKALEKAEAERKEKSSQMYPAHRVDYKLTTAKVKDIQFREKKPVDLDKRADHFVDMYKRGQTIPPITVHKLPNGDYEVIDGHARLEAYRRLGVKEIPVVENQIGAFIGKAVATGVGGVRTAVKSFQEKREEQKVKEAEEDVARQERQAERQERLAQIRARQSRIPAPAQPKVKYGEEYKSDVALAEKGVEALGTIGKSVAGLIQKRRAEREAKKREQVPRPPPEVTGEKRKSLEDIEDIERKPKAKEPSLADAF